MKKEQSHRVVISGKIQNPVSEMVSFTVSGITNPYLSDTAILNEKGEFKTAFDLDQCRPVLFTGGKEISHMYLCPGDSVYISLNTNAFDESIKYEGKGADKNNFMAEYFLKFEDSQNKNVPQFYALRDTTPEVFMTLAEKQKTDAMAFLNEAGEESALPPSFINYMKTRIYFNWLSNLQMLNMKIGKDTSENIKSLKRNIQELITGAGSFKDADYAAREYQVWLTYLLKSNIYNQIRDSIPKYDKQVYDSLLYKRMGSILSPSEMQLYFYRSGLDYLETYNTDYYEAMKPEIEKYVTDTTWKKDLQTKYDDLVFRLNQPLPEDTKLYNLDDEDLNSLSFDDVLAKYKGNVIYLDFWASWCGPCKAEMPNSAALKEKLNGEDVTFLYVSVDADAKAWENMIKIMELHGLHYRLGKETNRPVSQKYDVQYIPHYILFDRKGRMVKNNMSRPGDPETERMIKELL